MLKTIYYIGIIFALAIGISLAIRLIATGVSACFNGSPVGLLYILAVYLVLYLLARFIFNSRFSKSSLIVLVVGTGNMCLSFIGLGVSHGIHPAITAAVEVVVVSIFMVIRRYSGDIPPSWVRGSFPDYVLPDAILDDCVVFRSGRKGFQVLQFAEVRGAGTGFSFLLSAWKTQINLSFETYRREGRLYNFVSVWEVSRDFGEAVERVKEKMGFLRAVLEKEGYVTRLIVDELEIERCLYSPLLANEGNRIEKLDKQYLDEISVNEFVPSAEVKAVLERVLSGEDFEGQSACYLLILRPVSNVDKEFRKAEKELKRNIEGLTSNKLRKNDPVSLIVMLSLTQDKSLIMQPSVEKKLKEARVKCQRMIDAKKCGLWGVSLFLIGKGGDMTRIIKQVNTEKSGENVYSIIRRRKYSEMYDSEEVFELLPIQISMNSSQEQSCEEEANFD